LLAFAFALFPQIFASITGWIVWLVKTPKGKATRDRMFLKLPVISGIISYSILERFCRILGAMVRAGVPLPDAMKTTTTATSNVVFHERLEHARLAMLEGGGFAKPLAETELFPGAARQMFKVGEETGTLDDQLSVASMYFDRELEQRIRRFTTMFEPIMIIFVGLVVGFVAVALVQAMYGVLGSVNE
ncbi:MAG: type II secretion system F family protein, partial [Ilumatobacteraceae bacterium]